MFRFGWDGSNTDDVISCMVSNDYDHDCNTYYVTNQDCNKYQDGNTTIIITKTVTLTYTISATLTASPSMTPPRTVTPVATGSYTSTTTPTMTVTPTATIHLKTATPTVTTTPFVEFVLRKSVDKATAAQGEVIHYTIAYQNNGLLPSLKTSIIDTIPDFTEYYDSDGGYDTISNTAYWSGYVLPGHSGEVWLEVKVVSALPDTPIVNEAYIISEGSNSVVSNAVVTLVTETSLTPGIIDIGWEKDVMAYPNPGRDRVTIAWQEDDVDKVEVELFTLQGERCLQRTERNLYNNTVTVDISRLAPGLYFYRVILYHENEKRTLKPEKLAVIK